MEQYRGVRGQHWLARLLLPRPAMEHGMTIFPLHTHTLTYRSGTVRKVGKHRHVSCEIRSVPPPRYDPVSENFEGRFMRTGRVPIASRWWSVAGRAGEFNLLTIGKRVDFNRGRNVRPLINEKGWRGFFFSLSFCCLRWCEQWPVRPDGM